MAREREGGKEGGREGGREGWEGRGGEGRGGEGRGGGGGEGRGGEGGDCPHFPQTRTFVFAGDRLVIVIIINWIECKQIIE